MVIPELCLRQGLLPYVGLDQHLWLADQSNQHFEYHHQQLLPLVVLVPDPLISKPLEVMVMTH